MTHYRILKDFDFSPAAYCGRVTIAYKAGSVYNTLTREAVRIGLQRGLIRVATAAEVRSAKDAVRSDPNISDLTQCPASHPDGHADDATPFVGEPPSETS